MSAPDMLLPSFQWPYLFALERLALALALGFFVGLERQRRGKDAGVRTFAFAGLIGAMGGLLGENFALAALALIGLLVVLLAYHAVQSAHGTELTTSAALVVIGFTGVLCGQGHTLTPTAVGVLTAALLAWKESFTGLSMGLTEAELRSAILLAILAFVVYPALPEGVIDPWGLVDPRAAWVTVLLIAGIGFGNYVLLKLYGTRAVELTGLFGGLVNSTVTVAALASRVRDNPILVKSAYRGILLATAAMLLRNGVLLAILAPRALATAALPLAVMLIACALLVVRRGKPSNPGSDLGGVPLQSPFSLSSAVRFGLLFLALKVAGTLSQWWLGQFGFYAVSLGGACLQCERCGVGGGSGVSRNLNADGGRHWRRHCVTCKRSRESAARSPNRPRPAANPTGRHGVGLDSLIGDCRGRVHSNATSACGPYTFRMTRFQILTCSAIPFPGWSENAT